MWKKKKKSSSSQEDFGLVWQCGIPYTLIVGERKTYKGRQSKRGSKELSEFGGRRAKNKSLTQHQSRSYLLRSDTRFGGIFILFFFFLKRAPFMYAVQRRLLKQLACIHRRANDDGARRRRRCHPMTAPSSHRPQLPVAFRSPAISRRRLSRANSLNDDDGELLLLIKKAIVVLGRETTWRLPTGHLCPFVLKWIERSIGRVEAGSRVPSQILIGSAIQAEAFLLLLLLLLLVVFIIY